MKEPRNKKNSSTDMAAPGVQFAQLERLLDFMASHGLEEFEYEHAGLRIRLKKAWGSSNTGSRAVAAPHILQAQPQAPAEPALHVADTAPAPASAPVGEELHTIKS